MNLSKSKYTEGVRCEKMLWLSCYKVEVATDLGNDSILKNGNRVGELARGLFGDYKLVEYDDYNKMIDSTKKYLTNASVICEASFSYDGNFCSVDILKNDKDGIEIYEVKSSTERKDIYIDDVAYQTWILNKLGYKVKKSNIIYINNKYVKHGEFEINKYFIIEDVSTELNLDSVEDNINEYKKIINCNNEPNIDLSISCKNPYACPYFEYCTKDLARPNVFDLGWGMRFSNKLALYYNGIISYKNLLDSDVLKGKTEIQVKSYLNMIKPIINKDKIKELLNTFSYPLYFLDFESYQDAIPSINGTRPYQQICFQYSLHYYLEEDGKLYHKEFLSDDYDGNPMYGLCKKLCEDIPMDSCVLVYNDSFEITRLKEMASIFPEFSEHLLNIANHIIDLLPPFKNLDYYVKEMGGSASIKKVLPALFPDEPDLDYHNLDQVHKGDEASAAYLSLKVLDKEEEDKLRKNMLKYCELDTYAMVKIYEKLKSSI